MTVRLDEMTWPEVKEVLKKPNVIILPVGATEQHGAHLPLNVDSILVTSGAERAARKAADKRKNAVILVAPTLHYTDVSAHKEFPGTIGIKIDTLIKTIEDIVRNFLDQGFKSIIVLNGHTENSCSIEAALRKVAEDCPHAGLYNVSMIVIGRDIRVKLSKAGIAGVGHALEGETSMSLLLQPQNVKLDKTIKGSRTIPLPEKYIGVTGQDHSKGIMYYAHSRLRGWEESGILGDPTMSTKEDGEEILNSITNDFADIILEIIKLEESIK